MSESERLHRGMHEALAAVAPVAGGRIERRDGYELLSIPTIPFPELNCVWVLEREDDERAAMEIEGAVAELEAEGLPAGVVVCTGWSPRVEEEARRLGLTFEDYAAGMVATPSDLAPFPAPGLEITRVDGEDLPVAQRVAEEGFGTPAGMLGAWYTPEMAALPGMRIYVARAGGVPVSTSAGFTFAGVAGVYNVATPPEHRGKGYGAAVSARAALDGFAEGADLAGLEASALGEPVYRRLGFREVLGYVCFSRPAAETSA